MGKFFWDANIDTARESKDSSAQEGNDGNKEYPNGTYGQSDYTVRGRTDGKSDVYVKSGSDKGHSHDVIDEDGNLIESYHDFKISQLLGLKAELIKIKDNISDTEYVENIKKILMR